MSKLSIEPGSFILFLDETGHENLNDPHYPILGIGGCAIMGDDYDNLIRKPWRQIKNDFFGNPDFPLHAADSRNFTEEQVKAIAKFFTTQAFSRFAAVMKITTTVSKELIPYQAVALAVMKRIEKLIPASQLNSVHLVFEASDRTDILIARHFEDLIILADGHEIPTEKYRMTKSTHEPGLEVADFIIHTAGGQVRSRLNGSKGWRKDFSCVFRDVAPHLTSYIEINKVETQPSK
jgi:hypothetical protein